MHEFTAHLLAGAGLAAFLALATAELERDSYPPPPDVSDWQEDHAPDGTAPGTDCPDGREWSYWCGCEPPFYGDDC